MIALYVYSLPRSGSNLLAALLHNHPAVYGLCTAGTRRLLNNRTLLEDTLAGREGLHHKHAIYQRGFAKRREDVQYLSLIHVLPRRNALPGSRRVALLRQARAVLTSRDRFHRKYGRKEWALTPDNAHKFLRGEWEPLMARTQEPDVYAVDFEELVHDPGGVMAALFDWLGLDFEPEYISTRHAFETGVSACCRAPYDVRNTEAVASAYLQATRQHPVARPHFHCTGCGRPALGYGLFNPLLPIDPDKADEWRRWWTPECEELWEGVHAL